MTLRTGDLIDRARNRHPQFTAQLIPDSVAFDYVNETQRRLMRRIAKIDLDYFAARWVITLLPDLDIAQVGAGSGQAPLEIAADSLIRRNVNTGAEALMALDTSIFVSETVVAAADSDSLLANGVSWVTNSWQNALVQITAGKGAGQMRVVDSNSTDTLVVSEPWQVIPDGTSLFLVRALSPEVSGDHGAIFAQQPSQKVDNTFLVRVDANGNNYLDLAQPVQVKTSLGIPLPPGQYINHGHVFFRHGEKFPDRMMNLTLTKMVARYSPPNSYCAAVQGRELFLCTPFDQWSRVERIEIPYMPLPPRIASADALVFMADDAEDALVGGVVLGMCDRIEQMAQAGASLNSIRERAMEAETDYLDLVTGAGRAEVDQFEDVGY